MVNPNPGSRPFQRLNRAEYARAVKDMLAVDVDVASLLPADTISNGFDNVADVAGVLDDADGGLPARRRQGHRAGDWRQGRGGYGDQLPRAEDRVAVGARRRRAVRHARRLSTLHTFPADGDYVFKVELHSNACGVLFGGPERRASRSRFRSTASARR